MTSDSEKKPNWPRRFLIGSALLVLLLIGGGYAWLRTPSYSLYRIKQALETHDYALFIQYVDVDSVLDHALDEVTGQGEKNEEEPAPRGSLAKALRKGLLKNFAHEARAVVKAGLEIVVEQSVKNQESQLPEIPASAVVAALWVGQAEGDTANFPIKMKKGNQIEVTARQTPEGRWRVVEIKNLPALLPSLKSRSTPAQAEHQ